MPTATETIVNGNRSQLLRVIATLERQRDDLITAIEASFKRDASDPTYLSLQGLLGDIEVAKHAGMFESYFKDNDYQVPGTVGR